MLYQTCKILYPFAGIFLEQPKMPSSALSVIALNITWTRYTARRLPLWVILLIISYHLPPHSGELSGFFWSFAGWYQNLPIDEKDFLARPAGSYGY